MREYNETQVPGHAAEAGKVGGDIDLFQDMHLQNARKIREVINSKERSLDEFFKLLDDAAKFMRWLHGRNPDEALLTEYFEAVTKETWLDRLLTKTARRIITAGLAAAVESIYPTGLAIAATQGLSFLDATLLDKILKSWKPDQLVNGEWSEFVSRSN